MIDLTPTGLTNFAACRRFAQLYRLHGRDLLSDITTASQLVGTLTHTFVEWYLKSGESNHRNRKDVALQRMELRCDDKIRAARMVSWDKTTASPEEAKKQAYLMACEIIRATPKIEEAQAEVRLRHIGPDFVLNGRPDMTWSMPDGHIFIDIKTNTNQINKAGYQLGAYAAMVEKCAGIGIVAVNRAKEPGPARIVLFRPDVWRQLSMSVAEEWAKIGDTPVEEIEPSPLASNCRWCAINKTEKCPPTIKLELNQEDDNNE